MAKENRLDLLLAEIEKLQQKNEFSKVVKEDYFEPGMMEYLDQYKGTYDESSGVITIRFDARGTRYEGRTREIESIKKGQKLIIVRDENNQYNRNNFYITTADGINVGNMPAELCNVIAPMYDNGELIIRSSKVSFTDPISHRSRYAKQGILFVEMKCQCV